MAYGAAETAPRPSARRMAVKNRGCAARTLLEDLPEIDDQLSSADRVAERCSSLATAFDDVAPKRLSVVPSTKWGLERETGLEPATFSLEGLGVYAQWHPSSRREHIVSSYRVVVSRAAIGFARSHESISANFWSDLSSVSVLH